MVVPVVVVVWGWACCFDKMILSFYPFSHTHHTHIHTHTHTYIYIYIIYIYIYICQCTLLQILNFFPTEVLWLKEKLCCIELDKFVNGVFINTSKPVYNFFCVFSIGSVLMYVLSNTFQHLYTFDIHIHAYTITKNVSSYHCFRVLNG